MRNVLISFLLAILASVFGLVVPAYTAMTRGKIPTNQEDSFPRKNEMTIRPLQHATLAQVNGPEAYLLLAIPVAVAGLPLLVRSRAVRILSAVLITGWVVIGISSVGLFYIPSAVMMFWPGGKPRSAAGMRAAE